MDWGWRDTQGNGTQETRSLGVGLKFLPGWLGSRHKPHPFRSPRPFCSPAPIRREPDSQPIRRSVRRALRIGEPMGRQPERGLPGLVGAAGCLDTTCGREDSRGASGDLGDPAGVGGLGRAGAASPRPRGPRAVSASGPGEGAPGTRPSGSRGPRVCRPGPGCRLCRVPALLGVLRPAGAALGAGRWGSAWRTRPGRCGQRVTTARVPAGLRPGLPRGAPWGARAAGGDRAGLLGSPCLARNFQYLAGWGDRSEPGFLKFGRQLVPRLGGVGSCALQNAASQLPFPKMAVRTAAGGG